MSALLKAASSEMPRAKTNIALRLADLLCGSADFFTLASLNSAFLSGFGAKASETSRPVELTAGINDITGAVAVAMCFQGMAAAVPRPLEIWLGAQLGS